MNKAGKRKGAGLSILLSLLMAVGLGVLLYPTVSDQINKYRQQQTITDYIETTAAIDPELSRQMLEEAEADKNEELAKR